MSSRLTTSPACIVPDEPEIGLSLMRRISGNGLPDQPVLEINPGHPLIARLNASADDPHLGEWAEVLYSQAVLTLGAQIEDPAVFVSQLNDLLVALAGEGRGRWSQVVQRGRARRQVAASEVRLTRAATRSSSGASSGIFRDGPNATSG